MVTYVERPRVTFVAGDPPMLVLHSVPEAACLPPLVLTGAPVVTSAAASAVTCPGWRIVAEVTACVLSGPENAGFYIGALSGRHDVERQVGWLEAVRAAGGVLVVATDDAAPIRTPADLVDRPGLRGGFVPATATPPTR